MIKYAIFDLDDTLLDFKRGEQEGVENILSKYGVQDVSKGMTTYLKINHQIWDKIEHGFPREQLLKTRFSDTFSQLGIEVDGIKVEQEYRRVLDHNFYKIDGADQLLEELKNSGIRLMVGTNGIKTTQLSRLAGSGLERYFEDFFISEDVGFAKPDRRFFNPIHNKYQDMQMQNTVVVGDRIQADILGAKRANLSSIWFNPNQLANKEQYQPTYVADNYDQVKNIILNA